MEQSATAEGILKLMTMPLEYIQAPFVGVYYLTFMAYAVCTLQKPRSIPTRYRHIATSLSITLLSGYLAEVIYYLSRYLSDATYTAPKEAAIRCLGSMLLWIPLCISLFNSNLIWQPYLGTFAVEFTFEAIVYLHRFFSIVPARRWTDIPTSLCAARVLVTLLLLGNGLLILFKNDSDKSASKADQSPAEEKAPQNGETKDSGDSEEKSKFDDEALGKHQAKRLEEQGGWLGYLKSLTIFLPYLLPTNDWKVMSCLFIRLLYLMACRVLNRVRPLQLGNITNELTAGATSMPWKAISMWALCEWLDSYSGLYLIQQAADSYIRYASSEKLTLLAYQHAMSLSMDFHTGKDSSQVLRIIHQATSLNSLVELVCFELIPVVMDMCIAVYTLSTQYDAYMIIIILFMAMAYCGTGYYAENLYKSQRKDWQDKSDEQDSTLNETVQNWQTVAYFHRFDHERERYRGNMRSAAKAYNRYDIYSSGEQAIKSWLISCGNIACTVFAMSQVISRQKPIGDLVTFVMYWDTIMTPMYMFSYQFSEISRTIMNVERVMQLFNTKPTVVEQENAQDLVVKDGKVEFQNVDFCYDPRKQIIKDVSFTAEGGQTVAFVGETGGGKSTMLKLLFRFYDVTGGKVLVDGQDVRSVTLSSLRESIGIVPQDPVLFNKSIRENIKYAKLDATDAEIEDACRAAAIHDDIVGFPDGYESKVGERGVRLSGGQLQRTAIARVLLQSPKMVMLDEATSAVDSAIEEKIQDAFRKLSKGRTTFVIAHRLSTIVQADQIVVVSKGEIIERGTHDELLEIGGKYHELWTKQTAGVQRSVEKPDDEADNKVDSKMCSEASSVKDEQLVEITPLDDASGTKASGKCIDGEDDTENGSVRKRK